MSFIRRTQTSRSDLLEIWLYIARNNANAADAVVRELERSFELLATHPRAGPARPELRKQLRSFPVRDYLIFYRPIENGIELLRVLHGSRDARRIFREGNR